MLRVKTGPWLGVLATSIVARSCEHHTRDPDWKKGKKCDGRRGFTAATFCGTGHGSRLLFVACTRKQLVLFIQVLHLSCIMFFFQKIMCHHRHIFKHDRTECRFGLLKKWTTHTRVQPVCAAIDDRDVLKQHVHVRDEMGDSNLACIYLCPHICRDLFFAEWLWQICISIILSKHLRNVNAGFVELAAVACDGGEIGGANATTATACRRGCLILWECWCCSNGCRV